MPDLLFTFCQQENRTPLLQIETHIRREMHAGYDQAQDKRSSRIVTLPERIGEILYAHGIEVDRVEFRGADRSSRRGIQGNFMLYRIRDVPEARAAKIFTAFSGIALERGGRFAAHFFDYGLENPVVPIQPGQGLHTKFLAEPLTA